MAGPRPDDPYKPNNSVVPGTNLPYDTLATRATGEDFGAAKGRALEEGGKQLEQSDKRMTDYLYQQQGLANEASANAAEMRLAVEGGNLDEKFKSLSGFDASNSKDKFVSDYTTLNDQIRKSLTSQDAQRAYDQIASRRMSFTIQNMNSHAATQLRSAYKQGNASSRELSIKRLSSPSVANSDEQSNFEMGNVIYQTNTMFTAPEYGDFHSLPTKIGKSGKLEFDTKTEQGRIAQNVYDNDLQKITDAAWTSRISAIANDPDGIDRVNRSVKMLQDNKENMSVATYAKLANTLDGPYRAGKARDMADEELSISERGFESANSGEAVDVGHTITTLIPGATISSGKRTPEHNAEVGGVPNSFHLQDKAVDVVLPPGVTSEQFKSQLAMVGIHPTEFIDEKDHIHVAWGDKPSGKAGGYVSKADYYRENYDDILDSVRKKADAKFGDPTLTDQTVAFAQTKINQVIHAEELQTRVDRDSVLDFVNGEKNGGKQVINSEQLYNAPKPVRDAWIRFQADNPDGAARLERGLIAANADGQALTYGSNFWKNYLDLSTGRVKDVTRFDVASGKSSAFTNTGFQELNKRSKDWQTPEGHTWQTAERKYLQGLQREYTGSGLVPGIDGTFASPEFNQVLKEVLPKIAAGKREGKTAAQLFSPTIHGKANPDYVTASPLPPSMKTVMERRGLLAMFNGGEIPTITAPSAQQPSTAGFTPRATPPAEYNSVDDVGKAYKSGAISKEQAYELVNKKFGGFAPDVPRPKD